MQYIVGRVSAESYGSCGDIIGGVVFMSFEKCAHLTFINATTAWAADNNGRAVKLEDFAFCNDDYTAMRRIQELLGISDETQKNGRPEKGNSQQTNSDFSTPNSGVEFRSDERACDGTEEEEVSSETSPDIDGSARVPLSKAKTH